jgi:hypothetical protein
MTKQALGNDESLLEVPARVVATLQAEAENGNFQASSVAALPRFLRTFYLRFLKDVVSISIKRFTREEGGRISDYLVDLEVEDRDSPAWPLLSDFTDLCRYFDDVGLMSVPQAAQEHDAGIFELTARVLYDLGLWAQDEGFEALHNKSRELAGQLESLGSRVRAA